MGMFDTINYICKCGKEASSQTKLGECHLDVWTLGDETTMPDGKFGLRDNCECGARAYIKIEDRVLISISMDEPIKYTQEGSWASTEWIDRT